MFFDVKDGRIYKHTSLTGGVTCVYSNNPKAVKIVASSDEKKALVLFEDGRVRCVETRHNNFATAGAIIYNQTGSLKAQDIAWEGNNILIKHSGGWRRK